MDNDILYLIFCYLDAYTLRKCAHVDRQWHVVAKHGALWKKLCAEDYHGYFMKLKEKKTWYDTYKYCYGLSALTKQLSVDQPIDQMASLCRLRSTPYKPFSFRPFSEPGISYSEHLRQLCFYSNNLKVIPKEIGLLTNLEFIKLAYNKIKYIPKEIGSLTKLECLELYGNRIKSIPKEIRHLTNLASLFLSSNRIKSVPKEIGLLSNLRCLSLCRNRLKSIPKNIGYMKKLGGLFLCHNYFSAIPKNFGKYRITNRDFEQELLYKEPNEINLPMLNKNGRMTIIGFDVDQLNNFDSFRLCTPYEVQLIDDFRTLYPKLNLQRLFGRNRITKVPTGICWANLQVLDLTEQQMAIVGEIIGQLRLSKTYK